MTFLYFAYGSNMLSARLKARCPSAKVIGKATALGYALEFTKPGQDSSGKATLLNAAGHDTPGVLFEIAKSDLAELDRAEGAHRGYVRNDQFRIELAGQNAARVATTYLASKTEAHLMPYDWYLALVIAGRININWVPGTQSGYVRSNTSPTLTWLVKVAPRLWLLCLPTDLMTTTCC